MQPQGQVTSIQLLDAIHVNVTVSAHTPNTGVIGQQTVGQPIATVKMLATECPPLGSIVEVTVRVIG